MSMIRWNNVSLFNWEGKERILRVFEMDDERHHPLKAKDYAICYNYLCWVWDLGRK